MRKIDRLLVGILVGTLLVFLITIVTACNVAKTIRDTRDDIREQVSSPTAFNAITEHKMTDNVRCYLATNRFDTTGVSISCLVVP